MVEEQIASTAEDSQEAVKEEPKAKAPDFKKPLDKMTAIELREVALEIPGLTGVHAMKKEELLPLIKEYYGIEEEEAPKGRPKKAEKKALSVHELKSKMGLLRVKKAEVRAAKDRKQTDTLRRRINRLKKQTRKAAQG